MGRSSQECTGSGDKGSHTFLTPEGFVYFLPAFLLRALQDLDSLYCLDDPVVFELWSFPEEISTLLRPSEKRAVVHALEYLATEWDRRRVPMNDARAALDHYWAYFTDAELGLDAGEPGRNRREE